MSKKILIVEDDKFLSRIYNTKLTDEGFNVVSAIDGEEGLEKMRNEQPDLVILDLVMPHMDGFAVLEEKIKDESIKEIPVIVMTNLGQDSDVVKVKELGAVDHALKSDITLEELLKMIQQYVG